jgi:hypothetical protein
MSNLIRFSFLLFLMSYQLKADELSYFSDGLTTGIMEKSSRDHDYKRVPREKN